VRRLLLALALLALAAGCGEAPRGPNVLFVAIDTLRVDHLGAWGYERPTSPAIDAFARSAVRFERAYATAPWTKPSVASMLTGLYPSGHGAHGVDHALPDSARTLAEILSEEGFATAALVSSTMLSRKNGFGQGFEIHRMVDAIGHRAVSTPGVTRAAVTVLRELAAQERPFLLFVHYFDPHYAFVAHPDVDFAAPRAGRLTGHESMREVRGLLGDLSPEELAFLRDLYDEEIRFTDAGVEALLGALVELGLEEDTVVVLTADHGEEFLERGWLGHTRSLYDELVRVPLAIRAPGAAPREVATPVSLASLTPTLLDLVGVDADGGFQAPSLAGVVRGETSPERAVVLSEVDYEPAQVELPVKRTHKKAVVADRFKLIRDDRTGALELYDLARDPGERRDLAPERPALAAELSALLETELARVREGARRAPVRRLSEDEIEQLRALGYAD